jgi:hypothetical protein
LVSGVRVAEVLDQLKASLAGRYVIEREIGRGGMATVYLAQDLRHERKVAIKVLREEVSIGVTGERFLAEIAIAAKLVHPGLVPVFDSGGHGNCLYYVMPYVEGESLRVRMDREKRFSLDDALRIAREVGEALAYAHARNVVHRDIKPENILLVEGHAMVSDFGIARAIEEAGSLRLTEAGRALGTPLYMSPEQASGHPVVDGRSDVYSLACVLYEMLAGDPPHIGNSPNAVMKLKQSTPADSVRATRSDVPPAVDVAIARALEIDPASRMTSAAEFVRSIGGTGPTLAVGVPARARRRWIVASVAAALVVAAAVSVTRGPFTVGLKAPAPDGLSVAVFPFRATAGDGGQWEEAIPDLLATALDGVPGLTVADPWSVWRDLRPDPHARARTPDPAEAAQLAQRARAGHYILGSIAQLQRDLEVTIRIYRGGTAVPWQTFKTTGSADSVAQLVQRVSVETIRRFALGESPNNPIRFDRGLTRSPEALKAWLLARESRRRGQLDTADAAIDRALALDSTFVIALVDAIAIKTWVQFSRGQPYGGLRELAERAVRSSDSLPERAQLHARALLASINTDGATAAASLNRVLAIDSTDFDAWSLLSYVQMVYGWQYGQGVRDATISTDRALRLDSTDITSLYRRAYLATAANDSADITRQVERLARADTSNPLVHGMLRGITALRANDSEFGAIVELASSAPVPEWIAVLRMLRIFRPDRADALVGRTRRQSSPLTRFAVGSTMQLTAAGGRWHELDSLRRAGTFTIAPGFDRNADRIAVAGAIGGAGDEQLARRSADALAADLRPDSALALFERRAVWQDGWLIGAYHAMYGDTLVAREWQLALGTLPTKGASPARYTTALRADIAARLAARRGDREGALQAARRAYDAWNIHTENQLEGSPEPSIRFHLASLLRASNRPDSAAALFRSMVAPTTWLGFYTARAALELAEVSEELNDRATAQRYFLVASRMWERGDTSIGALRDRARRGLLRSGESARR